MKRCVLKLMVSDTETHLQVRFLKPGTLYCGGNTGFALHLHGLFASTKTYIYALSTYPVYNVFPCSVL